MNTMTEYLQSQSACQSSNHFILQDIAQLKEEMIHQISKHPFLTQCRSGEVSLDRLNTGGGKN